MAIFFLLWPVQLFVLTKCKDRRKIVSEPKLPSEDWHWDNDRRRWVYMGDYGSTNRTYRWELTKGTLVYQNDLMMEAIDVACNNMSTFPDAERIIAKLNDK